MLKIILIFVGGTTLLLLLIYGGSLLPAGERQVSRLETIHGIPYSLIDDEIHIDEPLAHADIYVDQPVLAQELVLTLEFIPTNVTSLSVGVRANEFWLSYNPTKIYQQKGPTSYKLQATSLRLTIPLTDKLQEPDQSIDLMFFAEGEDPQWELVRLGAKVKHVVPTWVQFKDYTRAVIKRERAL